MKRRAWLGRLSGGLLLLLGILVLVPGLDVTVETAGQVAVWRDAGVSALPLSLLLRCLMNLVVLATALTLLLWGKRRVTGG